MKQDEKKPNFFSVPRVPPLGSSKHGAVWKRVKRKQDESEMFLVSIPVNYLQRRLSSTAAQHAQPHFYWQSIAIGALLVDERSQFCFRAAGHTWPHLPIGGCAHVDSPSFHFSLRRSARCVAVRCRVAAPRRPPGGWQAGCCTGGPRGWARKVGTVIGCNPRQGPAPLVRITRVLRALRAGRGRPVGP